MNLVGKNMLKLHETETRGRKWKKCKEEGRKVGNDHWFSLISSMSQTRFLYIFILWVKKRKEERGQGSEKGWKEEGRVGRKLGDGYSLLFKQEETKVKRKCLAHSSTVIKCTLLLKASYMWLQSSGSLRTSQAPDQSSHYPPKYSISGKVWSEELGCHGKKNKKHREKGPFRCSGNPTISVIISTTWISPWATDKVNSGQVT